jgi:hypothetical protein
MQTKPTLSVEKRLHTRHRAKTRVSIAAPGVALTLFRSGNLSAKGVYIVTGGLGLAPGTVVTLTFIIELGKVMKLHRRRAHVVHLHNGGTGFAMDPTG